MTDDVRERVAALLTEQIDGFMGVDDDGEHDDKYGGEWCHSDSIKLAHHLYGELWPVLREGAVERVLRLHTPLRYSTWGDDVARTIINAILGPPTDDGVCRARRFEYVCILPAGHDGLHRSSSGTTGFDTHEWEQTP